jgi:hypothetical protein
MKNKRKLQVSNGHYLQFDQLTRIMYLINDYPKDQKVSMSYLEENTGLPFRQVRNRVSIGRALGLIKLNSINLTSVGVLILNHDPFFEMTGTLEYLHYLAARNYANLIWFEVFNDLLPNNPPMKYQGWIQYFQEKLKNDYTDHSLKDHMPKEIRFIIDAYINQNFKKLEILYLDSRDFLLFRRHSNFQPPILAAMIYDFGIKSDSYLFQIKDLAKTSGSPPRVFGLDDSLFRQQIEKLHEHDWLRYETTHNLDQIRLKSKFASIEFICAYYENRNPKENSKATQKELF